MKKRSEFAAWENLITAQISQAQGVVKSLKEELRLTNIFIREQKKALANAQNKESKVQRIKK